MQDALAEFYNSSSPYCYVENNPISFIDPNGMFKTKFGAWWHKLWNGGDGVGEDKGGEYFVHTDKAVADDEGGVTVTSSRVFDRNGRNWSKDKSTYDKVNDFIDDYEYQQRNEEGLRQGIYQLYETRYDARMAQLSAYSSLLIPSPTKAITQIINKAPKTIRFGPKSANQFNTVSAYKNLEKGYTNVVGHGSTLNKMGVDKFIKMLQRRGIGGNLRLFVCGSAKRAQEIANKLGVNVLAPKGTVMPTSRGVKFSDGGFVLFKPQ